MKAVEQKVERLRAAAEQGCQFNIYNRVTGELTVIIPDSFVVVQQDESHETGLIHFREIGLGHDGDALVWNRTRRFLFNWFLETAPTTPCAEGELAFSGEVYDLVVRPLSKEQLQSWREWQETRQEHLRGEALQEWQQTIEQVI